MSYINAGGGGGGGSGVLGPVVSVPGTESDTGTPYEIAFDSCGNLYVCYATNSWARYINAVPFSNSARRVTLDGSVRVTLDGATRVTIGGSATCPSLELRE